jgi:hypothetical protein
MLFINQNDLNAYFSSSPTWQTGIPRDLQYNKELFFVDEYIRDWLNVDDLKVHFYLANQEVLKIYFFIENKLVILMSYKYSNGSLLRDHRDFYYYSGMFPILCRSEIYKGMFGFERREGDIDFNVGYTYYPNGVILRYPFLTPQGIIPGMTAEEERVYLDNTKKVVVITKNKQQQFLRYYNKDLDDNSIEIPLQLITVESRGRPQYAPVEYVYSENGLLIETIHGSDLSTKINYLSDCEVEYLREAEGDIVIKDHYIYDKNDYLKGNILQKNDMLKKNEKYRCFNIYNKDKYNEDEIKKFLK